MGICCDHSAAVNNDDLQPPSTPVTQSSLSPIGG